MKITKSELMRILQEEIATLTQEGDRPGMSGTDAGRAAIDQGRQMRSGLTDEERQLITDLSQLLVQAGRKTDLSSGAAGHRIANLIDALQKLLGASGHSPGPEGP
jgi:hypothetical protein